MQANLLRRTRSTGDGFRTNLNAGEFHLWRCAVQSKAPHATEQIPHAADIQLTHPVTRGGIQRRGNLRIGLEKTLRANIQRNLVKRLFQRLLLGEKDFRLPFQNSHMHRLNINRDHRELRQLLL